jgi:NTE family protein
VAAESAARPRWANGNWARPRLPASRSVAPSPPRRRFRRSFPPLRVDQSQYPAAGVDYVTLTDGGVYDNLGVNPLFRKRNALDYLIVSDGGKPFAIDERPTEAGSAVLVAAIGILMEQVRGLQFKRLELNAGAEGGARPVWFSIDSKVGEEREGDADFASAIGTNLKRLSPAEMAVLARHAGALLTHRLQTYAPELLGN